MKKILLVDDHEVVRTGLKKMFEESLAPVVFGEAGNAGEATKLVSEDEWDLVVLDISLGHTSGLELLKSIKRLSPTLPVLVLSMHSEEQYAIRAIKAGAAGYVTKDTYGAELVNAITKVAAGAMRTRP